MPAGGHAAGEIETDDAVHDDHHRRHDRGHDQIDVTIVIPVARRAAPTERQNAVKDLLTPVSCEVAHRRQIGQQPT